MLDIVFVCSGNICRSPMAESVVREHLRRAGLADRVRVRSAGTGEWHVGERTDSRAARALGTAGYRSDGVAVQLGPEHVDADLIVALDAGHAAQLRRLVDDPDQVRLLRSFDPASEDDLDVPDPYYGGRGGFAEVLAMIEAAAPGLVDWARERA